MVDGHADVVDGAGCRPDGRAGELHVEAPQQGRGEHFDLLLGQARPQAVVRASSSEGDVWIGVAADVEP